MPSAPYRDQTTVAALDPAQLAAANINPATGLANDYLNHFNEAIMMLEILPTAPECIDDLLAWQPVSYRKHFEASKLNQRDLAIAAYDLALAETRRKLDQVISAMDNGLVAVREALRANPSQAAIESLAQDAAVELRKLVGRASAVINGTQSAECSPHSKSQATVDALLGP